MTNTSQLIGNLIEIDYRTKQPAEALIVKGK